MKLDITSIMKNNGGTIAVHVQDTLEDLETDFGAVSFKSPVDFSGSVTNNNGIFVLKGLARISYETFCDRCGKRIKRELDVDIDEGMIEKSGIVDDTEDLDDDRFTFSGSTLDLDRVLTDYILTNTPTSHKCREDCPGLCPECGSEINGESCGCGGTDSIDSRFDALKGFFD